MTGSISVSDRTGERRYERADLPLVLGGEDTDIPVAGLVNGARAAFLGMSGDAAFIQPGDPQAATVLYNGEPLVASRWLKSGDLIQVGDQRIVCDVTPSGIALALDDDTAARDTLPPEIVAVAPAPSAPIAPAPTPSEGDTGGAGVIEPVAFRPGSGASGRKPTRLPLVPMALFGALAMLAAVAWYMFTARPVLMQFAPEPDRVSIDGSAVEFELGDRYLLRPGTYTVVAQKAGFRDGVHEVTVTRDEGQSHSFTLVKLPGRISVDTGEVAGATVTIDGQPSGSTPLEDLPVEAGMREFVIAADGYVTHTAQLDVVGADERQVLAVDLVPNVSTLTLTSVPYGAELAVDGEAVGVTPYSGPVVSGERTVSLRLAGYKTWESTLELVPGEPADLPEVALEKADGMVSVRSTPTGAAVTVNGAYRGQTPLRLSLPPNKTYRLGFTRAGYEPAARSVTVRPEEGASLSVSLIAVLGDVRVTADPADAQVFVDGSSAGAANQTLRLPSVPHQIEVRRDGYEPYQVTVTPTPGFPQVVTAKLATRIEAAVAAVPATTTTRGGYELIRVTPGSFTMGASRRETGRRANEVLRPVELTRPYYIGARPVTNKQYLLFDGGHSSGNIRGVRLDEDSQPVVNLTWDAVARYCNWLSGLESLEPAYVERDGTMVAVEPMTNGYRLPTEAEWAWAGRYAGGATAQRYPWGDAMPPASKSGNYADVSAGRLVSVFMGRYLDGYSATSPVGIFPANALGLYDIGGNVAEWMHDFYAVNPATSRGPARDPTGPSDGAHRVVRGSSWMHGSAANMRLAYRDYSDAARADLGFRLARYTE